MNSTGAEPETRFAFGENWRQFLELVDEQRIAAAVDSLRAQLGDLTGRRFVDVGSGSGLFSLAAHRMGAEVVSFDYDPQSVACTAELWRRYGDPGRRWRVEQGSILDKRYVDSLGVFDVVYSWGVLHHTGDLDAALGSAASLVAPGGRLFISIYNDQGRRSRMWTAIKEAYNEAGPAGRRAILTAARAHFGWEEAKVSAYRTLRRLPKPNQTRARGMDKERDLVDWVGGYPFEVAKPEDVFRFYRDRGFTLVDLTTCGGGLGCNEFVFTRSR